MTINYPDELLTMAGKYLPELTSLFAMRYISRNVEPVVMPQSEYENWCTANGLDMYAHVKELAIDGCLIDSFRFFLKLPADQWTQEKSNGQTWKEWAESTPAGSKFSNLKLSQNNGFYYLRPSHFAVTPAIIIELSSYNYLLFTGSF